jgi:hypothetical protein
MLGHWREIEPLPLTLRNYRHHLSSHSSGATLRSNVIEGHSRPTDETSRSFPADRTFWRLTLVFLHFEPNAFSGMVG